MITCVFVFLCSSLALSNVAFVSIASFGFSFLIIFSDCSCGNMRTSALYSLISFVSIFPVMCAIVQSDNWYIVPDFLL